MADKKNKLCGEHGGREWPNKIEGLQKGDRQMTRAGFLIKYVLARAATIDNRFIHRYEVVEDAERAWDEITKRITYSIGEQCFACEEFKEAMPSYKEGQTICPTCLNCSRHYNDLITVKIGG